MMLLLIIVGLLFASTSGQPTITQLTSGELVTSSLGPNSDEVAAVTTFEYYSIPLPLNIKFAAITFNANPTGSTACGALSLFWSVRSIPCGSKWQVNSTYLVPCREGLDITTQGTNVTYLYNEAPSTVGRNQFEPGTTLYLSVGKDAADYLSSCPYSLNVSITNCGESEVGFLMGYSFDSLDCLPLLTGTFPLSSPLNLGEGAPVVYRFPVGSNVGRIDFQINSTGEVFAMGSYNYPPATGVGHDCEGSSSQSGGKWVTSSSCEQPKAGYFYLTIFPYEEIETASIAIDEVVCDDLGGYNCNFYVHNDSYFEEVTRTIPRHQYGSTVAPFDTYYIDLPAGTLMNINYTVCSGNNTLFFVAYRKGGYADAFSGSYRDEGNEKSIGAFNCAKVILRPEDTFLGGLFYIGVQNANTNRNATYVITMASSVVEWTTGSSGSTTGEQTSTTGEQVSTTGEQTSTTESSAGVTTTGGQSTTDDQIDSGTSVLKTSILLVTIAILGLSA